MSLPSSMLDSLNAEWIDGEPDLSSGAHIIDFWSSACSSCVEKIPAMNLIQENYPVKVSAVHSPEFSFQDLEHLEKEAERHGIDYRLGHETRTRNRRRASHLLVVDGSVMAQAGTPAELEQRISQELDVEKMNVAGDLPDVRMEHLGSRRCRGINGRGNFRGEKNFSLPRNLRKNRVYLEGRWKQTTEYLEAVEGRLHFLTGADRVDLVADPSGSIKDIELKVDSKNPEEKAGKDVQNGSARVKRPGVKRIASGEGEKEVMLDPEPGTRLYRLNLLEI